MSAIEALLSPDPVDLRHFRQLAEAAEERAQFRHMAAGEENLLADIERERFWAQFRGKA